MRRTTSNLFNILNNPDLTSCIDPHSKPLFRQLTTSWVMARRASTSSTWELAQAQPFLRLSTSSCPALNYWPNSFERSPHLVILSCYLVFPKFCLCQVIAAFSEACGKKIPHVIAPRCKGISLFRLFRHNAFKTINVRV